jgi:hypothetical protein
VRELRNTIRNETADDAAWEVGPQGFIDLAFSTPATS